jgi:hypothetical protein
MEPLKSIHPFSNRFLHVFESLSMLSIKPVSQKQVTGRALILKEWRKSFLVSCVSLLMGQSLKSGIQKMLKSTVKNYNSKHGITAISFFVVSTPEREIISVSRKVDIPHITTRNKGKAFFQKKIACEKLLDIWEGDQRKGREQYC